LTANVSSNAFTNNDALQQVYDSTIPNPPTFNILWITDPLIDYAYNVEGSKTCGDSGCCHVDL
jgi:hypothetical protein